MSKERLIIKITYWQESFIRNKYNFTTVNGKEDILLKQWKFKRFCIILTIFVLNSVELTRKSSVVKILNCICKMFTIYYVKVSENQSIIIIVMREGSKMLLETVYNDF